LSAAGHGRKKGREEEEEEEEDDTDVTDRGRCDKRGRSHQVTVDVRDRKHAARTLEPRPKTLLHAICSAGLMLIKSAATPWGKGEGAS
jgi:hypothetical protein